MPRTYLLAGQGPSEGFPAAGIGSLTDEQVSQ